MKKPSKFSPQEIKDICDCYTAGIALTEISKDFNIAMSSIYEVLKKGGVPAQRKLDNVKDTKICKCNAQNPSHANYCMSCGVKFKTERECVIEGLTKLCATIYEYLPASERDATQQLLVAAITTIKKDAPASAGARKRTTC